MSEYYDESNDYVPYEDNYGEFNEYQGEERERIEVNVYELASLVRGIMENKTAIVMNMLNNNIRLSACADATGRTLLMYAAYTNSNGVLGAFLDHNLIPPDVEDVNGFTAFDWAVLGDNPQGAKIIHRWIKNNQPLD
jgi:hypothetical protein